MAPDAARTRHLLWYGIIALLLRSLRSGQLTVEMPGGGKHLFPGSKEGPHASIRLVEPAFARRLAMGGDIALAEGYMDGAWETEDLGAVLRLGLENLSAGWISTTPILRQPVERLRHALRDNDAEGGSKRNVAAHYDLGNDFYELWLDETMTYSAACVDDEPGIPLTSHELGSAQRRKWDRILDLLQPNRRDHLLEIGCGWGGFAIHAAKQAGCRITGLTLSKEQAALAKQRVEAAGLEDRVDILLQDYRHVAGAFDGVVSIEMFEAVGERWWPVFFARLRELLTNGSAAALQTITIAEDAFEAYRRNPDFIQRYIFPGGMLPSPVRFNASARDGGLRVGEPYFFGPDYARTLAAWQERFESVLPAVRELGFDERFVRMWRYYLAYCRTGFEQGTIDVMQVRLEA